ncbi:MAG: aspartate 1-decarboxylase [Bacteroidetes bacterium]|nr:aspartate 1-decarboxylase [Bacteroidota bacterium]MBU1423830.1 aspartate 1-decarboxylase [Bacteroidota bacterium]MBU2472311.1 aspartate 1-decarboxylase [Bacteroidota bacterium]
MRIFLKSKIHNATVTEANLKYVGSITIDESLMKKAEIEEFEKVLVVDNINGNRLETYVIKGAKNSGKICMNGAAAHLIKKGHEIIIMTFQHSKKPIKPKIIIVDKKNKFIRFTKEELKKIKSSGC